MAVSEAKRKIVAASRARIKRLERKEIEVQDIANEIRETLNHAGLWIETQSSKSVQIHHAKDVDVPFLKQVILKTTALTKLFTAFLEEDILYLRSRIEMTKEEMKIFEKRGMKQDKWVSMYERFINETQPGVLSGLERQRKKITALKKQADELTKLYKRSYN